MLAKIEPAHNDFNALANYLIHGDKRPTHPERVSWVFGHNIPTDNPLLAAKLMAATAELSTRCTAACLHMSIDWHPTEQPTPEIMQEIARRMLAMAGLDGHQALVMGHGDTEHPHMHCMINRVDPATGRAWDMFQSYRRLDRIMKSLADEYGFQHVPCHRFDRELTDVLPKGPDSAATRAAMRGAATDRVQWSRYDSRRYGAQISDQLDRATGWDDLEFLFAEDGLTLEPKGTGLVVGNSTSYAKFSALGLTTTANGLARRFGPRRRALAIMAPRWDALRVAQERERLHILLTGAATWTDVATRLALHGLTLQPRGRGHVVMDATGCTSLSSLGWSAAKLERQFVGAANPSRPRTTASRAQPIRRPMLTLPTRKTTHPARSRAPPLRVVQAWAARRSLSLIDAVDIARRIGTKEHLQSALADATALRRARRARKPVLTQLLEEMMEKWRATQRRDAGRSHARRHRDSRDRR